ncbi:MAG: hypothetical protein IKP55_01360 [Clostridia bacterium]|nr:hypothetical protein [Clostridia bacterium]
MAMVFNHGYPRKRYSKDDFINFITFNSLKDHPELGDERYNFVTVRKHGENDWKKVIKVQPGDKFTVRIFFHNNADPSLNEKGVSKDTKISCTGGAFCSFEDEWESYGTDCEGFMAYISSENADPKTVQDFCVVDLPEDLPAACFCRYIEGSSRITNSAGTHSFPMSAFRSEDGGDKIGVGQTMDGLIPAGASGFIEQDYEVV